MSKEALLNLLGMSDRGQKQELVMDKKISRRTLVLRFKTKLVNEKGQHWYVFWIKGESKRRYSTNPDIFFSGQLTSSARVAKMFYIIDRADDGRQTEWLSGLFHDKNFGLIT